MRHRAAPLKACVSACASHSRKAYAKGNHRLLYLVGVSGETAYISEPGSRSGHRSLWTRGSDRVCGTIPSPAGYGIGRFQMDDCGGEWLLQRTGCRVHPEITRLSSWAKWASLN
eukprot:7765544-Pyramimonas_sp.AAC.3